MTVTPPVNSCFIENEIATLVRKNRIQLRSCLDIGCGRKPVKTWFKGLMGRRAETFTTAEVDPDTLKYLKQQGYETIDLSQLHNPVLHDLVIAKEVIEHCRQDETKAFLKFCRDSTNVLFALTTPDFSPWIKNNESANLDQALREPNAAYWSELKSESGHLRFVPDHFVIYNPEDANPLTHKQVMTIDILDNWLNEIFKSDTWEVRVMQAWPWTIIDNTNVKIWSMYFKLFAIVIHREWFDFFRKAPIGSVIK